MDIRKLLFVLGVAAILSNVVVLILIMAALDRRGHKTNMLLARMCPFKYLKAYKEATQREAGKPGRLYGLWIVTINLALVLAIAALFVPRSW
jgi:hypothetical protein